MFVFLQTHSPGHVCIMTECIMNLQYKHVFGLPVLGFEITREIPHKAVLKFEDGRRNKVPINPMRGVGRAGIQDGRRLPYTPPSID